jgi:hypothetical protein
MSSHFRFSMLRGGQLARQPLDMSEETLRKTLLLASGNDTRKVAAIYANVERLGQCRLHSPDRTMNYIIEKITA